MFPVSDFTFMVCGMASFAATVGYVCSKKVISGSSGSHFSDGTDMIPHDSGSEISGDDGKLPETETAHLQPVKVLPQVNEIRRSPLKRKAPHDEEDLNSLGYPYNLAAIYPNKRSRTPTRENENEVLRPSPPPVKPHSEDLVELECPVQAQSVDANSDNTETKEVDSAVPSRIVTPIVDAPSGEKDVCVSETPETILVIAQDQSTTKEKESSLPVSSSQQPLQAQQKTAVHGRSFTGSSGGFASFATTSGSAFTVRNAKSARSSRPAWAGTKTPEVSDTAGPAPLESDPKPQLPPPKHSHTTGEENEEVLSEARGVKLFVKRGSKEFSDSILGHVKLLSSGDRKRLVFRREPLWQVTMNTWLSPSVRCTIDEENVLRVIGIEGSEVVVYALKPGRGCPKQDFVNFADWVLERSERKGVEEKEKEIAL
ncbi:hypothetical protein L218DRAFT_114119 [Marasmius fiardii PR-910]|nr:hypothetical protein L218DRAFT_114119 [Marasmius fiardii PR-910]